MALVHRPLDCDHKVPAMWTIFACAPGVVLQRRPAGWSILTKRGPVTVADGALTRGEATEQALEYVRKSGVVRGSGDD